jgi:hypothetical protein
VLARGRMENGMFIALRHDWNKGDDGPLVRLNSRMFRLDCTLDRRLGGRGGRKGGRANVAVGTESKPVSTTEATWDLFHRNSAEVTLYPCTPCTVQHGTLV